MEFSVIDISFRIIGLELFAAHILGDGFAQRANDGIIANFQLALITVFHSWLHWSQFVLLVRRMKAFEKRPSEDTCPVTEM